MVCCDVLVFVVVVCWRWCVGVVCGSTGFKTCHTTVLTDMMSLTLSRILSQSESVGRVIKCTHPVCHKRNQYHNRRDTQAKGKHAKIDL